MDGSASLMKSFISSAFFSNRYFMRKRTPQLRRPSTMQMAISTKRAMVVASATPSTPMCITKMKKAFNITLVMNDMKYVAVLSTTRSMARIMFRYIIETPMNRNDTPTTRR